MPATHCAYSSTRWAWKLAGIRPPQLGVCDKQAMRNGQNKRMRGRNRKGQNPLTRVYESNGPDVKIRGTASHVADKYIQLARDAQTSGDPVAAENYFQHAEHYLRLIAAAQEQFRQANPYYRPEQEARDDFGDDDGDDMDGPGQQGDQPFGTGEQPSCRVKASRSRASSRDLATATSAPMAAGRRGRLAAISRACPLSSPAAASRRARATRGRGIASRTVSKASPTGSRCI